MSWKRLPPSGRASSGRGPVGHPAFRRTSPTGIHAVDPSCVVRKGEPGRFAGRRWPAGDAGGAIAIALLIAAVSFFLLIQAGFASAASRGVVLRGTLLIAHAGRSPGAGAADFYLLKTRDGYCDLHFDCAPDLKPNQGVLISGVQKGRELSVSHIEATADGPPSRRQATPLARRLRAPTRPLASSHRERTTGVS
jgi:hypothetical protein